MMKKALDGLISNGGASLEILHETEEKNYVRIPKEEYHDYIKFKEFIAYL